MLDSRVLRWTVARSRWRQSGDRPSPIQMILPLEFWLMCHLRHTDSVHLGFPEAKAGPSERSRGARAQCRGDSHPLLLA